MRVTGLNPEDLVGAGVAMVVTGDEAAGGAVITGVAGTATGSEIVWTAPGTVCPALFCWDTWRRLTLGTLEGTMPVTDADTDTSSLVGYDRRKPLINAVFPFAGITAAGIPFTITCTSHWGTASPVVSCNWFPMIKVVDPCGIIAIIAVTDCCDPGCSGVREGLSSDCWIWNVADTGSTRANITSITILQSMKGFLTIGRMVFKMIMLPH